MVVDSHLEFLNGGSMGKGSFGKVTWVGVHKLRNIPGYKNVVSLWNHRTRMETTEQ